MGNSCCGSAQPAAMHNPVSSVPASPFEQASKGTNGSTEEVFPNPLIVDDDKTVNEWQDVRQKLSQASHPVLPKPDSVWVNTSFRAATKGSFSGVLQRVDSRREAPVDAALPDHGAEFLSWTMSRKLLEVAIAAEQQSIPEEEPVPVNEWDAISIAEQRLQTKLYKFKLENFIMEGDGNCQFRAVSFGLYGTQQHYGHVRQRAVQYMRQHTQDFVMFLGEDVGSYLQEMSQPGTWGDELTLRAICDTFGICINVITSDACNWFLRYLPQRSKVVVRHEVFLTYIAPVHYNAIRRRSSTAGGGGLEGGGSFLRKHSQIIRAVDAYEKKRVMPDNPERLTELVGRV